MKSFGVVPKLSLVTSILMILNTYYRLFYFNIFHRIPLSDVPVPLRTPLSTLTDVKRKISKVIEIPSFPSSNQSTQSPIMDASKPIEEDQLTIASLSSSHDNTDSVAGDAVLVIRFTPGPTGIVYQNKLTQNIDGETSMQLSVFMISNSSTYYQMGLRRGWIVDTAKNTTTGEKVDPTSNRCSEECVVTFRSPPPELVKLTLLKQINSFSEIGLVVSQQRSCYHNVKYLEVESVESSSDAYKIGVRAGHRIISVNGKFFVNDMRRELFAREMCDWYAVSCRSGREDISIVFKRPRSFMDKWSLDGEIFNNHLRDIYFLIFSSKNGVPYFCKIPLFYTDVLDNFAVFNLYLIVWLLVIFIQAFWILSGLWCILLLFRVIPALPKACLSIPYYFSVPLELYLIVLWIQFVVAFFQLPTYIAFSSTSPYLLMALSFTQAYWLIYQILLWFSSFIGPLVYHPWIRPIQLLLWFVIFFIYRSVVIQGNQQFYQYYLPLAVGGCAIILVLLILLFTSQYKCCVGGKIVEEEQNLPEVTGNVLNAEFHPENTFMTTPTLHQI